MTAARFVLPADRPRDEILARMVRFVHQLDAGKAWEWTCAPYKKRRSTQQNRYLWQIYRMILEAGGEELGGWTKEDLHDFFLIEHFGSEEISGFGRRRLKPIKRSPKLSTVEFNEFIEFIQRFMAERGVYLPDPDEA